MHKRRRRTDYPFMDEIRPDYQLKIIKGEIGCMEKIPFICKEHGEYWKRIDNRLYYSQKCPVCSKKIQENINHNIKKRRTDYPFMDEIRPDYQLKIIKGEIGCMEKIPFICNIHGEYLQSLKDHNKGNGCPKCGNSRKGRRKNNE